MAKTNQPKTKPPKHGTAGYWRARANEARTAAAKAGWEGQESLHAVAQAYEILAVHSDPETRGPLVEYLAEEARERAEQGERHIAEHRDRIAKLKRNGHDTHAAEELLRTFEEMQVLHKEHADRLSREAAAAKRKTGPRE